MNPIKARPTIGPTTAPAIQALLSFFSGCDGVMGVGIAGGAVGETDAELGADC